MNQPHDILIYTGPDGDVRVEVFFQDETLWLTQRRMAELFGVEVHTINYHLKEVFKSREVEEESGIRKLRIPAPDGKQYLTNLYHLDVVIAVGYRVNSFQATRFRIWATNVLREFIIKGFALDKFGPGNGTNMIPAAKEGLLIVAAGFSLRSVQKMHKRGVRVCKASIIAFFIISPGRPKPVNPLSMPI